MIDDGPPSGEEQTARDPDGPPVLDDRYDLTDAEWSLLGRHFAGESSAADTHELEQWMAADPSRRWMLAALGDAWHASAAQDANVFDGHRLWAAILARRDQ